MCYPTKLLKKLKDLDTENQLDFTQINKAIYWAKKYHHGQFRKSGETFYTHPLEVAYMVSEYLLKTDVIIASILHDIVEDTEVTAGMILDSFGQRIEEMVDRLTRDRPDGSKLSVEEILNNAYENDDKEVLLVKIVDRIHNLSTVSQLQEQKITKQIQETYDSLFPGMAATFNLALENLLFNTLQQRDTQHIYKNIYNTEYTLFSDYGDFTLGDIKH